MYEPSAESCPKCGHSPMGYEKESRVYACPECKLTFPEDEIAGPGEAEPL